jgi:hypothetical protein
VSGQGVDPLTLLRSSPHLFHEKAKGEPWGLRDEALAYLASHLPTDGTTLETGSGESTVVFLARSNLHIAIAPDDDERAAIVAFCERHGIDATRLQFHVGLSERVLPSLDLPALDAVLIDGQHAFPVPFLDWFYTADQLKRGGFVLIDDVQIRTGRVLRQFLRAEPEWRHLTDVGGAAVFEKLVEGPISGKWWRQQPWGAILYPRPGADLREQFVHYRNHIRIRTRLREAWGRHFHRATTGG